MDYAQTYSAKLYLDDSIRQMYDIKYFNLFIKYKDKSILMMFGPDIYELHGTQSS